MKETRQDKENEGIVKEMCREWRYKINKTTMCACDGEWAIIGDVVTRGPKRAKIKTNMFKNAVA